MQIKRILSAVLAVAVSGTMLLPALTVDAAAAATDGGENRTSMKLWYDEPAKSTYTSVGGASKWEAASLPIGNGVLGANVFGEVGEELLTINEETLWSGGRGSVRNYDGGNPDDTAKAKQVYNQLADYYVQGTWTRYNMEDLRGDLRDPSGYDDGYQPLGDLKFSFGHSYDQGSYERALDLDNGLSTVKYTTGGVTYTREYFASNPGNVIVAHFTASQKDKLTFTTSFASKQNNSVSTSAKGNTGYITVSGKVANNGLLHNTQIAVVADGGRVSKSGNGIKVSNANSVTVYLTAATDYKNQFSNGTTDYWYRTGETAEQLDTRVKGVLDTAVGKGYDAVKTAHIKDYTGLYDRVKLNLGQTLPKQATDNLLNAYKNGSASAAEQRYLEVLLYQYGRYLLISGSRANDTTTNGLQGVTSQLPTTLQGIWNDTSKTDWNSDIHTNINLEMNYWLSGNANLAECALPLVDYMSKLEEPGGRTVEIYTGSKNGIMAHTQNTPFGYTAPGWEIKTWGWSPAAATWLMQNCYDYYQYSGDIDTLRSTIYPMMKEQVLMYEDLLMMKDGRKVMPIALSPEIGPVTSGNTFEQSLIWQLYADTIEAAKILGETDQAFLNKCNTTIKQLDPIVIGDDGQIKEWYNETTLNSVANTSDHRHLSNLLGLFPGDLIASQKEIDAARVSLDIKDFGKVGATGANPEGGWTYGQMIPSWARVGDGANAYFCVNQMIKTRLFENLWDYHNDAIFQIDGNYGYTAGVGEMLMQSNRDVIRLLPAVPEQWAKGSVSGLLAEGGVEVAMSWQNQKVTEATLTAKQSGTIQVQNPFGGTQLLVNNEAVTCGENGIAAIEAVAGQTYKLTAAGNTPEPPQPEVPEQKVEAQRDTAGKVTLTWEAKPDVTYEIFRKEIQ